MVGQEQALPLQTQRVQFYGGYGARGPEQGDKVSGISTAKNPKMGGGVIFSPTLNTQNPRPLKP